MACGKRMCGVMIEEEETGRRKGQDNGIMKDIRKLREKERKNIPH